MGSYKLSRRTLTRSGSDWHDIGLKGGLDYELIDFV